MASTTTGCNEHNTESGQKDNCIMVPPFPSTSLPRRTADGDRRSIFDTAKLNDFRVSLFILFEGSSNHGR